MTARWPEIDPDTFSDERVESDPEPSAEDWNRQFHDECTFLWSEHDNSDPLNKGPFGCPSETMVRMRWPQ